MDEQKQIEEMAKHIAEADLKARGIIGSMNEGTPMWYAKELYAAGYRKQSGWISVDERLPDGNGRFLVVDDEGYTVVASWDDLAGWILHIVRQNPITHWMPLPEPPKGE